jgi:uncharacterized lipoprotein YddW (UPF0748 family)
MKKITKVLLSTILVLGMLVTSLQVANVASADVSEDNPMRALWLRPKEKTAAQVEAAVEKIADAGINTIFLETVFNGYTIFPVDYDYTYQNPMYNGFDVLQAYIDECHERGIQVHSWVESFFIGMAWENNGGPVYAAKKDWLLTDTNGNNYEDTMYGPMYFLNPARPECREWLVGLFEIIVKNYDVDGIQLDYVRYPEKRPDKDYGYDDYSANAFMESLKAQGKEVFDPREVKPNSFEAGMFEHFKREQVTEYVKLCSERLRAARPDLLISLSVYPFFSQGLTNFMQSAELWMQEGYGDFVASMAYYENQVASITENTIKVAGGDVMNSVTGISTQNGFTVDSINKQTQQIFDAGAGVAFFEYETFYSGGYADSLADTLLKDTQFNIDVDTYRTDVERDDATEGNLPLPMKDIILYVALGVAVLVIVVSGVILIHNSRKKKRDLE